MTLIDRIQAQSTARREALFFLLLGAPIMSLLVALIAAGLAPDDAQLSWGLIGFGLAMAEFLLLSAPALIWNIPPKL